MVPYPRGGSRNDRDLATALQRRPPAFESRLFDTERVQSEAGGDNNPERRGCSPEIYWSEEPRQVTTTARSKLSYEVGSQTLANPGNPSGTPVHGTHRVGTPNQALATRLLPGPDVNPNGHPWVWIPAPVLIRAMRTPDANENRGYVLVREGTK
jgi:hypothetical protein